MTERMDTLSGQMRVLAEYWRNTGGTISVGTVLQFADTAERLEERVRLLEHAGDRLLTATVEGRITIGDQKEMALALGLIDK